ncbi:MAG: hypothetical protein PQJ58_03580, partial [Spirochaetales bacterium]|nr:hypothetical protein [Spirochaetales bacterium]
MFLLNPSLLMRIQHFLLFSVFWLGISTSPLPVSPFSPLFGPGLFLLLDLILSLVFHVLKRQLKDRGFSESFLFLISLILFAGLFGLVKLFASMTAFLPLPFDFLMLQFHGYLLPVLPAAAGAGALRYLSLKGRGRHLAVLLFNLLLLALVLGRGGWSLRLVRGDLGISYALIFLFLYIQILQILSGGRSGRRLALLPALLLLILPLAGVLPLSRLYRNESRKEGGGLLEESLFRFDFSDYLSLESSISMKDDLVFLMSMEGRPDQFLTRRYVLSSWS